MSIFKDFMENCHPEYDEPVVLYDVENNTYKCISEFKFDDNLFGDDGQIHRWVGESRTRGDIYQDYPSHIKWCSMEDIVDKFFARLGVKKG